MAFKPNFDAVIFDLDGVITKTALVHASAWKKMFDDYMIITPRAFWGNLPGIYTCRGLSALCGWKTKV